MRCRWHDALNTSGLMDVLAPFDPHVIGTLPLGLALPSSDIDVAVFTPDPNEVAAKLWLAKDGLRGLSMRRWTGDGRPLVANFQAFGWEFEVFAACTAVRDQVGWRHFDVERRLLTIGGSALQRAVLQRRLAGMKTEPAFADLLGLEGDPYAAMSRLFEVDDRRLARLLNQALERSGGSGD
jgi:hypothetical protein